MMSLLEALPHRCTIRHRTRKAGALGGAKDAFPSERTDVECWEQQAGANETADYEKRGMSITTKIYFTTDPGLTSRHQILVTERDGATVSSPVVMDVMSVAAPDVSAGMGLLFRVMCNRSTSGEN